MEIILSENCFDLTLLKGFDIVYQPSTRKVDQLVKLPSAP